MNTPPTTHPPSTAPYQSRGRRRATRARRWIVAGASVVALGLVAWPVMSYFEIPPFTDEGAPVSYDQGGGATDGKGGKPADSKTLLPTGPKADFRNAKTMSDGTQVSVVSITGGKSGFKGKVWVWAPKEYMDPKFAKSGFPVLIALPGGPGHDGNYWAFGEFGNDKLSLEGSITKWYQEGKSKPFLLAMPILNPGPDDGGIYWDGSDIPGQPKMGTWLTEDVPDLMKANFRTLKSRDGWAFMGSSTGGFVGLKSVLQKPDKFKAVIASGPDIVPDSPLWKGHETERQQNNPEVLAKELIARKGPDVYLAFQYGTKENKKMISDVTKFIATYGDKGPVHTKLNVIEGGTHNGATYLRGMDAGPIEWISEHLEGPTPAS
ncbi:alpha/beta hydrolase-fold protein [Streptomyces sp. NPDC049555]|uniref:alpha/beta hydrolase n=1 Tax=unclassified Streptomyces TaxID=2593676 RepID=UPI003415552C